MRLNKADGDVMFFDIDDITHVHVRKPAYESEGWCVEIYLLGLYGFFESFRNKEEAVARARVWLKLRYETILNNLMEKDQVVFKQEERRVNEHRQV